MYILISFFIGIICGLGLAVILYILRKKDSHNLQAEMKNTFLALSQEALSQNAKTSAELFSSIGEKSLDGKKELIDQRLEQMKKELDKVHETVVNLEKDREKKYGELSNYLKLSTEETQKLMNTTSQLKEALASSKARGQWGERMAEDILRLSGLIEGINYEKQKALDYSRSIPDFTFYLPNKLKVNMDVKFPLNNYWNFLNTENTLEQDQFKQQFLRDVKLRIKEVTSKDYIDPENNTVDYALVFIPNEQVYSFINEHDRTLIDEALKAKVIFCSPLTLYALLSVIRQATDNFMMERKAAEMLSLIGSFKKQWDKFKESMEKMGRKITEAQSEYQNLQTTRTNQLDRPLQKIEDMRQEQQIELIDEPAIETIIPKSSE